MPITTIQSFFHLWQFKVSDPKNVPSFLLLKSLMLIKVINQTNNGRDNEIKLSAVHFHHISYWHLRNCVSQSLFTLLQSFLWIQSIWFINKTFLALIYVRTKLIQIVDKMKMKDCCVNIFIDENFSNIPALITDHSNDTLQTETKIF